MAMTSEKNMPQVVIDAGALSIRIFAVLLTHEGMGEETIAEKANIKRKSVSPVMTLLRRTGWVEATGKRGELKWKRRTQYSEPQPDFQKRRDTSVIHHLKQAQNHIGFAIEKAGKLDVIDRALRNVDLAEYLAGGVDDDDSG
jgi:transcription initiation factor IIE alpha subunit